jgi:hypothetical protein
MKLHKITVVHYSQKDSHESIEAFLLTDDEEQVIRWLRDTCFWAAGEEEDDNEEVGVAPTDRWWSEHPGARDRALSMGLTIDPEYGTVSGPQSKLVRWWRGDVRDPEDLYYGDTLFWWDKGTPVSEPEAEVLIRLGVVEDLRATQ